MSHLSIDLETFSSVNIGKSGLYKYVQSPDFEILLFAYSVDDYPVEIIDLANGEMLPDWLEAAIGDPAYIKHAYNAAFEWYCLSKYFGATLPVDQWRDTMLHGLYCGFTAGLDATGYEKIFYHIPKRKSGGSFKDGSFAGFPYTKGAWCNDRLKTNPLDAFSRTPPRLGRLCSM